MIRASTEIGSGYPMPDARCMLAAFPAPTMDQPAVGPANTLAP